MGEGTPLGTHKLQEMEEEAFPQWPDNNPLPQQPWLDQIHHQHQQHKLWKRSIGRGTYHHCRHPVLRSKSSLKDLVELRSRLLPHPHHALSEHHHHHHHHHRPRQQNPNPNAAAGEEDDEEEPPERSVEDPPYELGPRIEDWDAQRAAWLRRHPERRSFLAAGKPRVLLVTGSSPRPCENPVGDHYLLKSIKNKIDYCCAHGLEIFDNTALLDTEMAGFWAKLPLGGGVPLVDGLRRHVHRHGLRAPLVPLRRLQPLVTRPARRLGAEGPVRAAAGKLLTSALKDRPVFEADDQSAMVYLLATQRERWGPKVHLESGYYLHGYWGILVHRYEEMIENHRPGLGDHRWPLVTHFVGCKPCAKFGYYPVERCLKQMDRAFNFGDNQILQMY
ncbi:putative glycosyltransferase 2, partial [Ananas comosus]